MLDRPQLRPLSGSRVENQGRLFVGLEDPMKAFPGQVLIPVDLFQLVVRQFDGSSTIEEIQARVARENGANFPLQELEALVEQLDKALVLEGPAICRYREEYGSLQSRPAAFAGRSYPADPETLRDFLARLFDHEQGSGQPDVATSPYPLRAILCPHIDFGRGGPTYTWAYKELIENSDADVFVILGVAHQYCRNRFVLTRKDFETPLGKVATDRTYVNALAEEAGNHFFEDELAHRIEHSVEFQTVFLQFLLGGQREFQVVPILAGSFHDLMARKIDPIDDPEVRRMVNALKKVEKESGKKVAYIGGIDLCHVGPEFGDPTPVDDATLDTIRTFDQTMLHLAARNDPAGWFQNAAAINNRWRVCGLAATYTMLQAIGPVQGRLLHYDQAINPSRSCCVTFASVAYGQANEA